MLDRTLSFACDQLIGGIEKPIQTKDMTGTPTITETCGFTAPSGCISCTIRPACQ